jgi:hypothetical protein
MMGHTGSRGAFFNKFPRHPPDKKPPSLSRSMLLLGVGGGQTLKARNTVIRCCVSFLSL